MHRTPRLRVELRPSRSTLVAVAAGGLATIALTAALPVSVLVNAALIAACGIVTAHALAGVPRTSGVLVLGADRRLAVIDTAGRCLEGIVLDASFVGARLATIVWRPDGERRWRGARTILVVPSMLPAEDFRRLRIMLRYGRPATSGRDAV